MVKPFCLVGSMGLGLKSGQKSIIENKYNLMVGDAQQRRSIWLNPTYIQLTKVRGKYLTPYSIVKMNSIRLATDPITKPITYPYTSFKGVFETSQD